MEPVSKPKNRLWPLFFAIFVLFFLVVIVTVAIIGLQHTATNTYDTYEMSESTAILHNAHLNFEKTRTYSREFILYAGDSEHTEGIGAAITGCLDSIDGHLNEYTAYITSMQEMEMAQEISHLTVQYKDYLVQMIVFEMSGDVAAMEAIAAESVPLANEISAIFAMLTDFTRMQVEESAFQTENLTNTLMILLISVAVVAFILIIIAAIVLIIITKPQDSEAKPVTSGYQYRYRTDYTQTDGLSQAELQQCLSDLRAVTNELSQALKERQR